MCNFPSSNSLLLRSLPPARKNEESTRMARLRLLCFRYDVVSDSSALLQRIDEGQRKLYGYYHNPASIMRSPFNLSRYDALPPILESIDFFREKGMTSQVDRISFRYLVVIQSLYQNTALHFPEEKERMIKLLKEYDWFLPRVLTNLDLPDEVSGQLLGWRQDPMKTKVNGYWYYVGNGLLPD